MKTTNLILPLILILAPAAMAESSDLDALREAAQNAKQSVDETTAKMDLLAADMETAEQTPAAEEPVESTGQAAESSEPMSDSGEAMMESADAMPEAGASMEEAAETVQAGTVARSAFTTAIQDREPVDELQAVDTSVPRVFFFTELMDLEGQQITHRWLYQGEVMGEVMFQVGGPRWRVNSSKNLMPEWIGTWEVEVVDGQGNKLLSRQLDVNSLSQNAAVQ